jgi:hypothetical protein
MTPFSRNSCQFCRLKKCFAVGMSREASRLGRRPKRPKDEKETHSSAVNNSIELSSTLFTSGNNNESPNTTPLKQQSQPQQNHSMKSQSIQLVENMSKLNKTPTHQIENSSRDETIRTTPNLAQKINAQPTHVTSNSMQVDEQTDCAHKSLKNLKKDKLLSNGGENNLKQQQQQQQIQAPFKLDTELKISSEPITLSNSISELVESNLKYSNSALNISGPTSYWSAINKTNVSAAQQQKELLQQQMQQIEMLTKLIGVSDRHTSIERTNELEYIRTSIIESHCQICPTTFEKIRKRYLERPPIRAPYSPMKTAETMNGEIRWDNFVEAMVPLIMDVVKFCKYIPGFNHILQHDQVQLLKQGSFEVICVNCFMLVDAQNKLMLTPDMEFLMDSNTIKTMPLGFFMSEVFELGIQVSPLKLTDSEIALFNSILIMNPGNFIINGKNFHLL